MENTDEGKMNLQTFIAIRKYKRGIESRLKIYLIENNDAEVDKTLAEWDSIYQKEMTS